MTFPSSFGRGRRPPPSGKPGQLRKNDRIRAREVRLIGPDGKQVGILPTVDALRMAKQYMLDLVEIAPTAKPPVCRILDFGKFMYEESKKKKESHQHVTKIKEVKFRVRIEQHDYMTKLRHAEEFLFKGNKVKITLQFRGREMEHTGLGMDVVRKALADLAQVGVGDSDPRLAGRTINVIMSPLPTAKRKLKFNEADFKGSTADASQDEDGDDEHEET